LRRYSFETADKYERAPQHAIDTCLVNSQRPRARRLPEQIDFRPREIFPRPAIAVAGFARNCPENGYWRTPPARRSSLCFPCV
jgi:hypothetical protein